jgi:polyisoprenyl-teichoic acid--peptidoglycan teichoic acid transferase
MTEAANPSTVRPDFPYHVLIRIALLLIYLISLGVSALVVYLQVRDTVAMSDVLPDFTLSRPGEVESPNVERVEGEALPVWTGTDPVTVLILGIDQRGQEEDFWRSDTMMLATLDPVTKRAGVLSIPRDLWVPIPGYNENRINTAHFLGDAYKHPGGGAALAVETVEYNLGIDNIDYHVIVNFQAFVDLVDLIGGIEIDVEKTIDDPLYPGPNYDYDPLYIEAGRHHFYGDMALKYARVRRTFGGDFDRARRQQQVVQAILKRVIDAKMLPQLASRAPEIWQVVESSVRLSPNLRLDQIIALAHLATQVDLDTNLRFRVIDEQCTLDAVTPDNAQVLVPLRSKIRDVRDEVFWLKPEPDQSPTVEEEKATIAVLNGSGQPGLAYATSEYLTENGFAISKYSNADRQYDTSLIILNRDKPMTALQLLSVLRLPQSAIVNGANPTASHDIVVILGADYVEGLSEPSATPDS